MPSRVFVAAACAAEERTAGLVDDFFTRIDENGDGEISFEELSAHLAQLGFQPGAIEHIFDLLDVNRDGCIERSELQQSFVRFDDPAMRLAMGLGATDADDIFDAIDANSDGEISVDELADYLELNSVGDGVASANKIFQTLDANGDGSVSRAELKQGYEEYNEFRNALGLGRR